MNSRQAKLLWQKLKDPVVLKPYSGSIFNDGIKPLRNFHQWADEKNIMGAVVLTHPETMNTLLFLIIAWQNDDRYYLVIFPKDKSGPLAEIKDWQVGRNGIESLCWKYKPMKQDGKNDFRKKYFTENFYDTSVYINIPSSPESAHLFVDEVFTLVDNRIKADTLSQDKPIQRDGFPEGKEHEVRHVQRERNPILSKLVRKEFLRQHEKLFCQACQRDFEDLYGKMASRCFEAHHTIPISELSPNAETKIYDIALVCANCHRVLHRKRPWLTMDRLREVIKEQN